MRATASCLGALFAATAFSSPAVRSLQRDYPTTDTASVDQFLLSIGINSSTVTSDVKQQRGCALACAILGAVSAEDYVTESTDPSLYEEESHAFWSASAWKSPMCIVSPDSIDDLSIVVRSASFSKCKFAVRSGGHSPFAGFASIDGGILISMEKFTDLSYDETTQVQRSGMGNRWGNIYSFLKDKGRLVVGGRLNDVGPALAIGGGLSHLSNKYGWVGQNMEAYEVMLANGSHVKASQSENPDLFFGIKAGNNNFGVVTHLNQRTYPLGKVWGGLVTYSGSHSKDFMAAMAQYQAEGQLDTNSAILPYVAVNNDTILSTFVYLDAVEKPAAFAPFYNIPNTSDSTQIFDSFYDFAHGGLPSLPRWTYGVTTVYLNKDVYTGLIDVISKFIPRVQKVNSGTLALMAQPISESMAEQSKQRGDDPFDVTPKAQLWATINVGWALESDSETVYQIVKDCVAAVDSFAKKNNVFDQFRFTNDASPYQKPLQSYGAGALDRLKRTSRKYDPTGVFQTLVPGGFKVLG